MKNLFTRRLPWALSLLLAMPGHAAVPQRIASLSLCADQLLLMLVPRERIVSVTDWAVRPESSYMAAAAQGLPLNHGLVEGVLPQHPDLILAGEYTDVTMVNLLRHLGYRVAVVSVPQNLDEVRTHILRFGELVGAPERARELVAAMDARLQRIDQRLQNQPPRLAAAYAPNGLTVGRGAVLAEIIERAGWRNLGSEMNIHGYGNLALEQLVMAQPELLVLDVTAENHGGSIAHSYLQHPALASIAKHARVVTMPPRLSECVGPMTIDAIELLLKQTPGLAQQ